MIRVIVNPDKVRFSDDETDFNEISADEKTCDGPFIHMIEISDERSMTHFITFWLTGQHRVAFKDWREIADVKDHDPAIYHREGRPHTWMYNDGSMSKQDWQKKWQGWQNHMHYRFDHQPEIAEMAILFKLLDRHSAISDNFKKQILDESNWLESLGNVKLTSADAVT